MHVGADRAQQRDQQLEVGHRRLVDDEQVGVDLVLVGPWPGIQPSAEWIVDASIPVDSAIRRAARPVGATSAIDAFCALAAAQISRIVAVLPVPGPPVTIDIRDANAARPPPPARAPGRGRPAADARRGSSVGLAPRRSAADRRRPARPRARRSAAGRPRRRSSSVSSTSWPASAMSCSSSASGPGPPSSWRRLGRQLRHRQAGRAVALGLAQHVDDRGPAAARRESRGTPAARAIVSAIVEPDAEDARELVRALRTTSCARSPYSAAIRGTSHASPCGASSRCSARVERSAVPRPDRLVGRASGSARAAGTRAPGPRRSRPARRRRSARAAAPPAPPPTCLTRFR